MNPIHDPAASPLLPILNGPVDRPDVPSRLPRWLKRRVPKGNADHLTARLVEELQLNTVCDHAKCPNRMECYSQKTATFMILGEICTLAFTGVRGEVGSSMSSHIFHLGSA